jgi:hypothetical protein
MEDRVRDLKQVDEADEQTETADLEASEADADKVTGGERPPEITDKNR